MSRKNAYFSKEEEVEISRCGPNIINIIINKRLKHYINGLLH